MKEDGKVSFERNSINRDGSRSRKMWSTEGKEAQLTVMFSMMSVNSGSSFKAAIREEGNLMNKLASIDSSTLLAE
jgi:hypothetical protein